MYDAKVVCDSIACGVRLTTMLVTFPRFVLAEFNTHRVLSRNSASSRAIPVERRIKQVLDNPFVPEAFTVNRRGMQATETLDDRDGSKARDAWLRARDAAVEQAEALVNLGVHKQHANRLLEPFCWHTVVVTATEWGNFFALRCHPAAQPEMQITAGLMRDAREASTPTLLGVDEWHLPFVAGLMGAPCWRLDADKQLRKISVVRCAAVSYERQDVERTPEECAERHAALAVAGHWSPFEHQARVMSEYEMQRHPYGFIGNFKSPWLQYRKTFSGEAVFRG